jgi:hypothetical protein
MPKRRQNRSEPTIEDRITEKLKEWLEQQPPRYYTTLDGRIEFGWLMRKTEYQHLRWLLMPPPRPKGRTPFDAGHLENLSRRREYAHEFEQLLREKTREKIKATGSTRGAKAETYRILAEKWHISEDAVRRRVKSGN